MSPAQTTAAAERVIRRIERLKGVLLRILKGQPKHKQKPPPKPKRRQGNRT